MNFLKKIMENPVFIREMILRRKKSNRKNDAGYIRFLYIIIMVALYIHTSSQLN